MNMEKYIVENGIKYELCGDMILRFFAFTICFFIKILMFRFLGFKECKLIVVDKIIIINYFIYCKNIS